MGKYNRSRKAVDLELLPCSYDWDFIINLKVKNSLKVKNKNSLFKINNFDLYCYIITSEKY